jgi:hypothetical protein
MFCIRVFAVGITVSAMSAVSGCGGQRQSPSAPSMATLADKTGQGTFGPAAAAAEPPFNLEAILRGDGFGLVTFRQEKDPAQSIITLDVWVRDLAPNATYSLQRAVDTVLDGTCTGTNWLTLGKGLTPEPIVTDASGSGQASLWRDVSAIPPGSAFDIYFRVVPTGTSDVALQSDCYRYIVRN